MSLKPADWAPGDHRQRAPFAHASSSADLTSPEIISPIRHFPSQPPTWVNDGFEKADTLAPGFTLASSRQSRSRSPSPNPFRIPPLAFPGLETVRFVSLCALWYTTSALSSNTGKVILNQFSFPVTLTIVQFFFVAGFCIVCEHPLGRTKLRSPTKAILRGILPMAAFQVGGHIFSSLAISRVPVSTVHTIKALSPLFTVFAYALLFGVSYSPATYLSLLPLTLGVMLACSFDMTVSNFLGLFAAFGSTLIFVSQNIFFKKIMPTNSDTVGVGAKLDKINLLFFSSSLAFVLMIPVWLYSDVGRLVTRWANPVPGPSVFLYFILNGTAHFAQNLLAFAILSSTSPVTYSIASLVKRIAVICLAIVWFKQSVHPIQAVGIALTGVGLWMYNNAKRDVEKGEKKMREVEAEREGILPTSDGRHVEGKLHMSPKPSYNSSPYHTSTTSAVRPVALPPKFPASHTNGGDAYPSPPASPPPPPSEPPNARRHRRQSVTAEKREETSRAPLARSTATIQQGA